MARLADEIKSKPFAHLEDEAMLNIVRTADILMQRANYVLKQFEVSGPQYNVLRILRGSRDGISCGQIAERMITRDPDITRLLDRLETRGLIRRERNGQDRRVVMAYITSCGLQMVERLDPVMVEEHRRQFSVLGEAKLRRLIELLEQARESIQAAQEKERNES